MKIGCVLGVICYFGGALVFVLACIFKLDFLLVVEPILIFSGLYISERSSDFENVSKLALHVSLVVTFVMTAASVVVYLLIAK